MQRTYSLMDVDKKFNLKTTEIVVIKSGGEYYAITFAPKKTEAILF